MNEQKNYAATRRSKRFGENGRCLSLAFHKEDFLKWVSELNPDAKGIIRITIAPRKTPSESNDYSVFEDKWTPKPQATPQQASEGFQQARQAADVPPNVGEDDVPF